MARQYYTTAQIGRIVGVSMNTARRWIDDGLLAAIRLPGSNFRRVPRASLVEFMQQHGMPLELLPQEKEKSR